MSTADVAPIRTISEGDVIDNRTICDVFGVANMGGIRVNKSRSLIVLVSNNTDATYRNEWKDDQLHFVGMGSVGPQKLDRQNRTLANSMKYGWEVHLFEVNEKSRYTYAGPVELADEPYMADQIGADGEARFVWVFPIRKKAEPMEGQIPTVATDHLPFGAYAVIGCDLTDAQTAAVNEALDGLKAIGVSITDQRDIDQKRYAAALERYEEAVLVEARRIVRGLIAKRRASTGSSGREILADDELIIASASNEHQLRQALSMIDRDYPAATEEIFDQARLLVSMPKMPESLKCVVDRETDDSFDTEYVWPSNIDRNRFKDFK